MKIKKKTTGSFVDFNIFLDLKTRTNDVGSNDRLLTVVVVVAAVVVVVDAATIDVADAAVPFSS